MENVDVERQFRIASAFADEVQSGKGTEQDCILAKYFVMLHFLALREAREVLAAPDDSITIRKRTPP